MNTDLWINIVLCDDDDDEIEFMSDNVYKHWKGWNLMW